MRLVAFARLAPLRSQADVQIRVNLMGKRLFDVSFHTAFVQEDGLSLGAWAAAWRCVAVHCTARALWMCAEMPLAFGA